MFQSQICQWARCFQSQIHLFPASFHATNVATHNKTRIYPWVTTVLSCSHRYRQTDFYYKMFTQQSISSMQPPNPFAHYRSPAIQSPAFASILHDVQGLDRWGLENFQRNTLSRAFASSGGGVGLMSHLVEGSSDAGDFSIWKPQSDDVILVADVDEIVKPDVLFSLSRCQGC